MRCQERAHPLGELPDDLCGRLVAMGLSQGGEASEVSEQEGLLIRGHLGIFGLEALPPSETARVAVVAGSTVAALADRPRAGWPGASFGAR